MPRNGYAWWYIDALSDCGKQGLTIIAFIGSVFSPYYAQARRRSGERGADPLNHCALNVSLYGINSKYWTMTERGRNAICRSQTSLKIGPSGLTWADDGTLTIEIDELTVPWPRRVRGQVILKTQTICTRSFVLDESGLHHWRPLAPSARIEVELDHPALHWQGSAYFDSNSGDEPLEDAFIGWQWCRAKLPGRNTAVFYEALRRDNSRLLLTNQFDAEGCITPIEVEHRKEISASAWRIARSTFSDPAGEASLVKTLEDGPFYARSIVSTKLNGERAIGIHEALSLDRFCSPWVQVMLPFRMPRRA